MDINKNNCPKKFNKLRYFQKKFYNKIKPKYNNNKNKDNNLKI